MDLSDVTLHPRESEPEPESNRVCVRAAVSVLTVQSGSARLLRLSDQQAAARAPEPTETRTRSDPHRTGPLGTPPLTDMDLKVTSRARSLGGDGHRVDRRVRVAVSARADSSLRWDWRVQVPVRLVGISPGASRRPWAVGTVAEWAQNTKQFINYKKSENRGVCFHGNGATTS